MGIDSVAGFSTDEIIDAEEVNIFLNVGDVVQLKNPKIVQSTLENAFMIATLDVTVMPMANLLPDLVLKEEQMPLFSVYRDVLSDYLRNAERILIMEKYKQDKKTDDCIDFKAHDDMEDLMNKSQLDSSVENEDDVLRRNSLNCFDFDWLKKMEDVKSQSQINLSVDRHEDVLMKSLISTDNSDSSQNFVEVVKESLGNMFFSDLEDNSFNKFKNTQNWIEKVSTNCLVKATSVNETNDDILDIVMKDENNRVADAFTSESEFQ